MHNIYNTGKFAIHQGNYPLIYKEHMVDQESPKHIHPFNGPLSGTTRVSRYQKGTTNLDFTEARESPKTLIKSSKQFQFKMTSNVPGSTSRLPM